MNQDLLEPFDEPGDLRQLECLDVMSRPLNDKNEKDDWFSEFDFNEEFLLENQVRYCLT